MVEVTSWKVAVFFLICAAITSYVYHRLYYLPLKMDGYSDRNFRDAAQAFRRLIQNEDEKGASFVVYYQGEKVVEMLGGYSDPEAQLPWTLDTVTQVFSLSSVTAAFSLMHLAQLGRFNHSVSLKECWPDFQGDITGSELLQNKNQLYSLSEKIPIRVVMDDVEKMDALLKDAHSSSTSDAYLDSKFFTSGLYLDAVVRRVDHNHRPIRQYFHEYFAHPLGLDALLGLPKTQFYRAARTQFPLAGGLWSALWSFDFGQVWRALGWNQWWLLATEGSFLDYKIRLSSRPEIMEAAHPSLTLFANARSLGRLFAMVAGRGTLEGRRVLETRMFDGFDREDVSGQDRVLSRHVALNRVGFELRRSPEKSTMVGFYGYGGQMAFADLENNLAIAYTTNFLHHSSGDREWMLDSLIQAVYLCLGRARK